MFRDITTNEQRVEKVIKVYISVGILFIFVEKYMVLRYLVQQNDVRILPLVLADLVLG